MTSDSSAGKDDVESRCAESRSGSKTPASFLQMIQSDNHTTNLPKRPILKPGTQGAGLSRPSSSTPSPSVENDSEAFSVEQAEIQILKKKQEEQAEKEKLKEVQQAKQKELERKLRDYAKDNLVVIAVLHSPLTEGTFNRKDLYSLRNDDIVKQYRESCAGSQASGPGQPGDCAEVKSEDIDMIDDCDNDSESESDAEGGDESFPMTVGSASSGSMQAGLASSSTVAAVPMPVASDAPTGEQTTGGKLKQMFAPITNLFKPRSRRNGDGRESTAAANEVPVASSSSSTPPITSTQSLPSPGSPVSQNQSPKKSKTKTKSTTCTSNTPTQRFQVLQTTTGQGSVYDINTGDGVYFGTGRSSKDSETGVADSKHLQPMTSVPMLFEQHPKTKPLTENPIRHNPLERRTFGGISKGGDEVLGFMLTKSDRNSKRVETVSETRTQSGDVTVETVTEVQTWELRVRVVLHDGRFKMEKVRVESSEDVNGSGKMVEVEQPNLNLSADDAESVWDFHFEKVADVQFVRDAVVEAVDLKAEPAAEVQVAQEEEKNRNGKKSPQSSAPNSPPLIACQPKRAFMAAEKQSTSRPDSPDLLSQKSFDQNSISGSPDCIKPTNFIARHLPTSSGISTAAPSPFSQPISRVASSDTIHTVDSHGNLYVKSTHSGYGSRSASSRSPLPQRPADGSDRIGCSLTAQEVAQHKMQLKSAVTGRGSGPVLNLGKPLGYQGSSPGTFGSSSSISTLPHNCTDTDRDRFLHGGGSSSSSGRPATPELGQVSSNDSSFDYMSPTTMASLNSQVSVQGRDSFESLTSGSLPPMIPSQGKHASAGTAVAKPVSMSMGLSKKSKSDSDLMMLQGSAGKTSNLKGSTGGRGAPAMASSLSLPSSPVRGPVSIPMQSLGSASTPRGSFIGPGHPNNVVVIIQAPVTLYLGKVKVKKSRKAGVAAALESKGGLGLQDSSSDPRSQASSQENAETDVTEVEVRVKSPSSKIESPKTEQVAVQGYHSRDIILRRNSAFSQFILFTQAREKERCNVPSGFIYTPSMLQDEEKRQRQADEHGYGTGPGAVYITAGARDSCEAANAAACEAAAARARASAAAVDEGADTAAAVAADTVPESQVVIEDDAFALDVLVTRSVLDSNADWDSVCADPELSPKTPGASGMCKSNAYPNYPHESLSGMISLRIHELAARGSLSLMHLDINLVPSLIRKLIVYSSRSRDLAKLHMKYGKRLGLPECQCGNDYGHDGCSPTARSPFGVMSRQSSANLSSFQTATTADNHQGVGHYQVPKSYKVTKDIDTFLLTENEAVSLYNLIGIQIYEIYGGRSAEDKEVKSWYRRLMGIGLHVSKGCEFVDRIKGVLGVFGKKKVPKDQRGYRERHMPGMRAGESVIRELPRV